MNKNQLVLSERRGYLINRAAQQRLALRWEMEPWQVPLALADRGITALRYVRRHPQWMVGIVILLTAARPAVLWRWLERGLITWQVAKTLGAGHRKTGFCPIS